MRAFLFLVLGLVLGACARPSVQPAKAPVVLASVDAASDLTWKTVALVDVDPEGNVHAYCSGVWVSSTAIMTAAHCVEDVVHVGDWVPYVVQGDVYAPGELHERSRVLARTATLQALDEAHDLALLAALAAPSHGVAAIDLSEPVRAGERAQSLGTPMGNWFSYSSGYVAGVRQKDVGINVLWVQATTQISPGNSGGGLFDEHSHLIGIASRAFGGRAQNLNFFVHVQYASDLLRAHPLP